MVTEEPRLQHGMARRSIVVDLSRAFLDTNGVTQNADVLIITAPDADERLPRRRCRTACENKSLAEAFAGEPLPSGGLRARRALSERFDATIGAATVLMPFAGKYQLTPEEAMVAKLPVLTGETDDATAMSLRLYSGDCALLAVPRRGLRRGGEPFQARGGRRRSA